MKHLLLLLLVISLYLRATAQKPEKELSPLKLKGALTCFYKQKYTVSERNKFYPFSISDTIKIVSFRFHRQNYPIKGDSVLTDSLIEVRVLTKSAVNTMTDILYNNFYKKRPNYGTVTQCFFPRNAILFYDKSGALKESILLCFQCDRHQESSDKVNFGSECTQKMELLRQFFVSSGLKFGTDKTIDLYPGEDPEE